MAYDKDAILQKALQAIEAEECVTIEEVLLYLPCAKSTFYALGVDDSNELKEAIAAMKVKLKKGMRRNWRKSENPALQIAEFKLMATDEEIEKITISKVKQDTTHDIKKTGRIIFDFGGYTDQTNENDSPNA